MNQLGCLETVLSSREPLGAGLDSLAHWVSLTTWREQECPTDSASQDFMIRSESVGHLGEERDGRTG